MLQLLPPVRIHAWGGLGSQLFAVALAEEFKAHYPKRSLTIVLHTGGVTRRLPEVTELFPHFEYQYQEDFEVRKLGSAGTPNVPKYALKGILKNILVSCGFLANCDNNTSIKMLRPWVLSIRGHYSYRAINSDFLRELSERVQRHSNLDWTDFSEDCALHYRLGDLLTLAEKNPISPTRLASKYKSINKQIAFKRLTVFSDSPSEVLHRLTPLVQGEVKVFDLTTTHVIAGAIYSRYFIGTSSKISFWIAAIRSVIHENRSALPSENFTQYARLMGDHINYIDSY